jgi:Putative Ig domain
MSTSAISSSRQPQRRSLRWFYLSLVVCLLSLSTANAQGPVAPVLAPYTPNPNGIVSGIYSHQIIYSGTATRFAATGLPSGITINATTGLISGRTSVAGNYTVTVTAWNATAKSLPLTYFWTIEPLPPGIAGTYSALLDRHDWYNGGYGGSLRLVVTTAGTYTGTITRGIHRNHITGRLNAQPGGVDPVSSFQVPRRAPYAPLTILFTLPIGTNSITGTLQEPEGEVAQITGFKAGFSASQPATAYAGRWNTAFELPGELIGNATYPQGATWASQSISNAGVVTWTSRLADGTANTFSTVLGAAGQTAVHLMLYGYAGSVQGTQTFNSGNGSTSGSLGWVKSANSTRSYSSGFPLHFLVGDGARYTPPAPGQQIFGIPAGVNNARLNFSQGGLATPYTQLFSIGANNAITIPATGASNLFGIKFSINFATGILTGTGSAMDFSINQPTNSRPGTFSALLIPGREQAVGHFLLSASRNTSSQILSGKVIGEENVIDQ